MGPNTIMIVHHAEKQVAGRVEGGQAPDDENDPSLTAPGWQRAGALGGFFDRP